LLADASKKTVTQLATDHGFWELGHFSVSYRALFGETPSEPLHWPINHYRKLSARRSSLIDSYFA